MSKVPLRKIADDKAELRSKIFGAFLACTRALAMAAQSYHWRTNGGNYYEDHLLFERIYNDVDGMVDGLAERGIGVSDNDALAEPNLQAHMIADYLKKNVPENASAAEFPKLLLDHSKFHLAEIKDFLNKLRDADASSDGIEDLLQGMASKHEEHVYLLQRRCKEAEFIGDLRKIADDLDRLGAYEIASEIDSIITESGEV